MRRPALSYSKAPSALQLPSVNGGAVQMPFAGSQVAAWWQASLAGHCTGLPPTQAPAWQVSVCVQALLSLHGVPLGFAAKLHPVAGSQTPVPVWHWSGIWQTTAVPPVQTAFWHVPP